MHRDTHDGQLFVLGSLASDFLSVRPFGRTHPDAQDFWDGNWITCTVEANVRAFRARVDANLRAEDFEGLRGAFEELHAGQRECVSFTAMEEWVELEITGDRLGHFDARCVVRDEPGGANRLEFRLQLDRMQLASAVHGLKTVADAFPVVGTTTGP